MAHMASSCLDTQELVDFVERRVDPPTRTRVEDHASLCESCRGMLSSLARSAPFAGPLAMSASQADRALAAGTRVGRYEVSHQVGAGGIGIVYAARDPELDRVVAVKILRGDSDPRMQQRLRREAIAMAQLTHPNVVAVYDVGLFDDRTFIAMEYVPGETLAHWTIQRRSPREILDAYCAAGAGLGAAHAAGVVHRDFKPENVLVGTDRRVRVGDFGLASTVGRIDAVAHSTTGPAEEPSVPATSSPALSHLTAPGTLLGTPYYLAPELYGGAEADVRSDQFSFCVALFAALYGEPPFEGDTIEVLRANVQAGRTREPRAAPRLPRRVRSALQRGLAADPAARFASIGDLLAELAPPPRRAARWAIGLGALAVTVALLAWSRGRAEDQRCTGAAPEFASAWNAERRAAIASAFTAIRAAYADDALVRVTAGLDRYAAQWITAHTDACRATRVRGEQTEAVLDLRMTCLVRLRLMAGALVDALATGGGETVLSSVSAVTKLPEIAACADLAALRQIVPPASDLATRTRIADLNARLAEARARYDTGALTRARELMPPIVAEARGLAYRPFEAEVMYLQHRIDHDLGDIAGTEASLQAALWSAEAGHHDEIAASSWASLLFIVGYERAELARAESLVPRATAATARLGGNAAVESRLEGSLAALALRKGDKGVALAHMERSVVLAERAHGADHLEVAKATSNLGITLTVYRDLERAIPLMQRTLQTFERLLGPNHPTVASMLINLGDAHAQRWNYAAAEPMLRRGLAVREAALGLDHRDVPIALANLSVVLRGLDRLDEALVLDRRGLEIAERAAGADDLLLFAPLLELGMVESQLGRFTQADDHLRRAIAIGGKVLGPDHPDRAAMVAALGDSLVRQSRWREAAKLYDEAIPALQRGAGIGERLVTAEANRARIDVELHQPARAIAALERLVAAPERQPPPLRPMTELTLARALWDSRGDRSRACRLADHALSSGKQIVGVSRRDIAEIERWLVNHRCIS
jgi:tetratricopeptide (TPR) repeat protein/predicted Ser/Thr protein kinase